MKYLPIGKNYYQNEVACRFLHHPVEKKCLIMTIPGGPGLSGTYLDHFLFDLANRIDVNVGILDLPNHGKSRILRKKDNLLYKDCLKMVISTINEISRDFGNLVLFGQSFGARLAFDALAESEAKIMGLFLTGFPYKFEHSSSLINKINNFHSDEENLKKHAEGIFSLYTVIPFSTELIQAITSEVCKEENGKMLDETPEIEVSAEFIRKNKIHVPIFVLEGDSDIVIPDDNLLRLKEIIPHASFKKIKNCGHFVMIENEEETIKNFSSFIESVSV